MADQRGNETGAEGRARARAPGRDADTTSGATATAGLAYTAKAISDYTSAIELDSTYAEAYFNRGGSYYEVGWYEEAIADLSRAIQLDPEDDRFYAWRSVAYLFNDQPDLAEADQETCEELRSRSTRRGV